MHRGLVVALLLAAACRFDPTVPSSVVVRCERDEDCPRLGDTCHPTLRRCADRADIEAPSLVSRVVTPRRARAGTPVEVSITVNEALAEAPRFWLVASDGSRELPLPPDTPLPTDFTWRLTFTAEREDGEGTATVFVSMTDMAGNTAASVLVDSTQFDFSPPTLVDVSVRPTRTRSSTPVAVLVTASEELGEGGELIATAGAASVVVQPRRSRDALSFTLETDAFAGATDVSLMLRGVTDLAGNRAEAMPLPGIVIDDVPPRLADLVIATPVLSRQPGFNQLRFSFTVEEADEELVLLGMTQVPCERRESMRQCTLTVGPSATEGVESLLVRASDAAGNVAELRGTVRFDFSPPRLLGGSAFLQLVPDMTNPLRQPRHARAGTEARVSFALDEETAQLAVRVDGVDFTLVSQQGLSWTYQLVIPPTGLAQGPAQVTAIAVDLVGNSGTFPIVLPAPGLVIDTLPPAPPGPGLTVLRIPWGADGERASLGVEGPPGTVEGEGFVRVFPVSSAGSLLAEVGRARTDATGEVVTTRIALTDIMTPWADFVDLAGNESPPVTVGRHRIRAVPSDVSPPSFTATAAELEGAFVGAAFRSLVKRTLTAIDDTADEVEGTGRWISAANRRLPPGFECAGMASDSSTGRLWCLPSQGNALFVWDDDRWHTLNVTDPEQDGPSMPFTAREVVDGRELGIWLFRNSGAWRWTGTSWVSRPWNHPRNFLALTYNSATREIVGLANTGELEAFDGENWRTIATLQGVTSTIRQLLWSQVTQSYFVADGSSIRQLSGSQFVDVATGLADYTLVETSSPARLLALPPYNGPSQNNAREWRGSGFALTPLVASPTYGTPQQPRYAVSTARGRVIAVGARRTWTVDGNNWRLLHLETTGLHVLLEPRVNGLATFNPVTQMVEFIGGESPGGAGVPTATEPLQTAVAWDGLTARPATWPPGASGLLRTDSAVASAPDGGVLLTSPTGSYTRTSTGSWQAHPKGAPTLQPVMTWNPASGNFLVAANPGRGEDYEWTGSEFAKVMTPAPDGGPSPPNANFPIFPSRGEGAVVYPSPHGLWKRTAAGWTSTPDVQTRYVSGCVAWDPLRDRAYYISEPSRIYAAGRWLPFRGAPVSIDPVSVSNEPTPSCAWDPVRERVVLTHTGTDVLEYDPALDSRPAAVFELPFSILTDATVASANRVDIYVRASGTGTGLGGTPLDGFSVDLWLGGIWKPMGVANTVAGHQFDEVTVRIASSAPEAKSLGFVPGGSLRFRVAPLGNNERLPASVRVDAVEVRVDLAVQ